MCNSQVLTKEEQKKAQDDFTDYQKQYNETGNTEIVWFKLEPLIRAAVGPAILKLNKFHEVRDFDEKVDDAVLMLMTRYIKNKSYNFGSLVTLAYWAAVSVCRKPSVVERESRERSYEELQEKRLREEHYAEIF